MARDDIMKEYPGMAVTCVLEGSAVAQDYDMNRVRIYVDKNNRCIAPPRVG